MDIRRQLPSCGACLTSRWGLAGLSTLFGRCAQLASEPVKQAVLEHEGLRLAADLVGFDHSETLATALAVAQRMAPARSR